MKELRVVGKSRKARKLLAHVKTKDVARDHWMDESGKLIDSSHMLISMLLPPAVKAFMADVESEVEALCGRLGAHGAGALRWGSQDGSIVLGKSRVAVQRPRVRERAGGERVLRTYARFQDPSLFDEQVFQEGIKHVSQRDYEKGLPKIAASFGMSKSSVSRSWIRTTQKQVEELLNRDLKPLEIVTVFIDGKRFKKLGVVVALGAGKDGQKHTLGIYQSSTENSAACRALLDDLEQRGLPTRGILFVVDGGSGLNKALEEKYDIADPKLRRAVRVRCWVHKWRNIEDVLDEKARREVKPLFDAVRDARDLSMAQGAAHELESSLKRVNASALRSWHEAKEDLLNVHRLGVGPLLRKSLSSTNPIESLNSLLEEDLRRVKRWRNSEHFQRWLATACLRNEKRMRRLRGYRGMAALIVRLDSLCSPSTETIDNMDAVA